MDCSFPPGSFLVVPSRGGKAKKTKNKKKQTGPQERDPTDSFARHTKRVLSRGSAVEIEAWLLAYPIFSSCSSSWPSRELFKFWQKR